jgi:uncharacterized protein YcbK (DUF882 family)
MGEIRGRARLRHPTRPLSIGISLGLSIGLLVSVFFAMPSVPAQSREPDRTLKLFFGHTGERGEFTFKRNGRYDRREIAKINHFLRDWRKNEDATMDPQLLDLVWTIYRQSGSRDYIHVVSAYRSPATNEMLRKRSSGVAKNSQHRLGKAMDFYLPDVPLAKLREAAMRAQGGGVGYYPRSGSPFVHVDTGNVRAWPRMSREQLIALFPNGNTLHLPADGKPLPGYEQAVARRKASGTTALAYLETGPSEAEDTDRTGTDSDTRGWLARVFKDDEEQADEAAPPEPTAASVEVAAVEADPADARVPRARPADEATAGGPAEVVVASVDAGVAAMLVMPAMATLNPEELGIGERALPPQETEGAIAKVVEQEDSADPVELAYAAPEPTVEVSDADRAILEAFAVLDRSAAEAPDPALVAALTREASAAIATEETFPGAEDMDYGPGVVVAAGDLHSYEGDEDILLDLIEAAAPADPRASGFEMPKPGDSEALFVAPEAASDVADLRGEAALPVDRFTTKQPESDQGFFTKLFASLIE